MESSSFARAVAGEFLAWEAGSSLEMSLYHHSNGLEALIHHLLFIQP